MLSKEEWGALQPKQKVRLVTGSSLDPDHQCEALGRAIGNPGQFFVMIQIDQILRKGESVSWPRQVGDQYKAQRDELELT